MANELEGFFANSLREMQNPPTALNFQKIIIMQPNICLSQKIIIMQPKATQNFESEEWNILLYSDV